MTNISDQVVLYITGDEAAALLRVVVDYSFALDLLDAYDHQSVASPRCTPGPVAGISLEETTGGHYASGSNSDTKRIRG
jgi:Na+/serine symporter